jgi:hypothetical protein
MGAEFQTGWRGISEHERGGGLQLAAERPGRAGRPKPRVHQASPRTRTSVTSTVHPGSLAGPGRPAHHDPLVRKNRLTRRVLRTSLQPAGFPLPWPGGSHGKDHFCQDSMRPRAHRRVRDQATAASRRGPGRQHPAVPAAVRRHLRRPGHDIHQQLRPAPIAHRRSVLHRHRLLHRRLRRHHRQDRDRSAGGHRADDRRPDHPRPGYQDHRRRGQTRPAAADHPEQHPDPERQAMNRADDDSADGGPPGGRLLRRKRRDVDGHRIRARSAIRNRSPRTTIE